MTTKCHNFLFYRSLIGLFAMFLRLFEWIILIETVTKLTRINEIHRQADFIVQRIFQPCGNYSSSMTMIDIVHLLIEYIFVYCYFWVNCFWVQ